MTTNYDLILKNAEILVFDSNQNLFKTEQLDLGILDGKIKTISKIVIGDTAKVLDLKGLTILPGVIDSQVHFREPGLTHKEDIESGTRAAILGGVTSVFEMPNTNPSTTTEAAYLEKIKLSQNRAHCHYAYFLGGAQDNTQNISELEKLPHSPGIKIFLGASFGSLLVDDDIVFEEIVKNSTRRLTIHSEDEKRLRERKYLAIEAKNPIVHPIWRDEESALISTKKSVALAEKYNKRLHMLHISSSEEMAFLAKNKHLASVEILPQFLTLSSPECYERLGTLAQQNPPIRDKRHMEFLWQAVLKNTVDIIGSDHAPHTLEEKSKPYPESPSGFPGVQTMLPIMLNHVHQQKLSIEKLTQLITENPRRLFKVKNKGRIEVGFDADLTVIDLKKEKTITNNWIASKCGYTPFDGMKVTGWPTHTILKGKVVMQDDVVTLPNQGQAIDFEK